jgi:hypothetical protein
MNNNPYKGLDSMWSFQPPRTFPIPINGEVPLKIIGTLNHKLMSVSSAPSKEF